MESHWLSVGTGGPGTDNIYDANFASATTATVGNLPANGETVFVRLWSLGCDEWLYNDYAYTAVGP